MGGRTTWTVLAVLALVASCGGTFEPFEHKTPAAPRDSGGESVTGRDSVGAPDSSDAATSALIFERVEPDTGGVAGGQVVTLVGDGFEVGCEVFFGPRRAPWTHRISALEMTAETPPGRPGAVDVVLVCPGAPTLEISGGYTYSTDLEVHGVTPAEGKFTGGTPVTVHGSGFSSAAQLLVGGRPALFVTVVDDRELHAVTPPGVPGPADLHVVHSGRQAHLPRAFRYVAAPRVDEVVPAVISRDGGVVSIRGAALEATTEVRFDGAKSPGVVISGDDELLVEVPPLPPGADPGPTDLLVTTKRGAVSLEAAIHYLGPEVEDPARPELGPLTLYAVRPAEGAAEGGERVALVATGLASAGTLTVLFGAREASIEQISAEEGVVWLETPAAHAPGPVRVQVTSEDGTRELPGEFNYLPPLALESVSPARGPAEGGQPFSVYGRGFDERTRLYVGALPATRLALEGDHSLSAMSPPGSPGPADVRVERGATRRTLPDGYLFEAEPALLAFAPTSGATAGGTRIEVFGVGFDPALPVVLTLGGRPCTHVTVTAPHRIEARTPPAPAGPARPALWLGAETSARELQTPYTYFDPGGVVGGTWGGPMRGSLNVTVLSGGEGVADAYVFLGSDPVTPHQGWTDANGQVTFSGPELFGRQTVSAGKDCHSAAGVVGFDAQNVVLEIWPNCPEEIDRPPPEDLDPAVVTGTVSGIDKYLIVPLGGCAAKPFSPVLCQPCGTSSDCGDEARCVTLPGEPSFCAVTCGGAESCPEGYACRSLPGEGTLCLPERGRREVVCRATRRGLFRPEEPPPGPGALVDSEWRYRIETRFGEQAVVCIGGVRDYATGVFAPQRIGARRGVVPTPRAPEWHEMDVALDVPLSGSAVLLADNAFLDSTRGPDFLYPYVFLDFGPGGVWDFEVHEVQLAAAQPLEVAGLPEALTGSLAGLDYTVALGALSSVTPGSNLPLSMSVRRNLATLGEVPTVIGPVLGVPRIELPGLGGLLEGATLRFGVAPEEVEAHFSLITADRLATDLVLPAWSLVVRGGVTEVALPDLANIAGVAAFESGVYQVGVVRVFDEMFDLDRHDHSDLDRDKWSAWSLDVVSWEL